MSEDLHSRLAALEAENANLRALQKPIADTEISSVCRVAIKLPPFWPDRAAVWFAQAEAQFVLAGIVSDETKYSHILSRVDHQIAGEIEDVVVNPPAQNKYEYLKNTLIKRFSSSEEQRLRKLLSEEELGDRKPTQFLRHLRSLAGTSLTDDNILRQLWLRRLPQHVQGILAAQADLGLDRIADMADKIVEANPSANICAAATTTPTLAALLERIEDLGKQVAALSSTSSERFRRRDRSRSRSSSRVGSRSVSSDKCCWYHKKFGSKAKKCITPCNWKSENAQSSQ